MESLIYKENIGGVKSPLRSGKVSYRQSEERIVAERGRTT